MRQINPIFWVLLGIVGCALGHLHDLHGVKQAIKQQLFGGHGSSNSHPSYYSQHGYFRPHPSVGNSANSQIVYIQNGHTAAHHGNPQLHGHAFASATSVLQAPQVAHSSFQQHAKHIGGFETSAPHVGHLPHEHGEQNTHSFASHFHKQHTTEDTHHATLGGLHNGQHNAAAEASSWSSDSAHGNAEATANAWSSGHAHHGTSHTDNIAL